MIPLRALLPLLAVPASCDLCSEESVVTPCDSPCDPEDTGDFDPEGDADSDADSDGDTDTDSDTDADGDADTDTGPLPDTGEVDVCETTDPEVPAGFVAPEGWYVELFAEGFDTPSAVRAPASGEVYLGAGTGSWDERAVNRLQADGTANASDPITDPDGIAVDSAGTVFAAGSYQIVQVESFDGGTNSVWHGLSSYGNINDLVIDTAHDDVHFVAMNDGQVIRVEQDRTETVLTGTGDESSVAVDTEGDLWVVRRNQGGLERIDRETLAVEQVVDLTELEPDLVRTNRVTVGPDGLLYFTSYLTGQGASVRQWDPENPGLLTGFMSGIEHEDNDPDDLDFSEADGCLYWSSPLTGRVWRTCACP